jgi:anthranilate synthase component 1
VVAEDVGDLETPVSAFLKLRKSGAKFLLESVEQNEKVGRYSFIGLSPKITVRVEQDRIVITENGQNRRTFSKSEIIPHQGNPLGILRKLINSIQIEAPPELPTLLGGLVGFISYDFARFLENIPDSNGKLNFPYALFYLVDRLLVFDHLQRKVKIICLEPMSERKSTASQTGRDIKNVLQQLRAPLKLDGHHRNSNHTRWVSNFTSQEFFQGVEQAKEHIRAGDVYQLVLSQRLTGRLQAEPFQVYRALRMLNPSPYMFYLDFDNLKLIGSSPEVLVKLKQRTAIVRPIAGTRPRGANLAEDLRLSEELQKDEKEKAEHIMLVDLGRNDLGRCCQFGTVKVSELMAVERYSHVMHLTTQVEGELDSEKDQFDLFRACFPAGTVTGAPKVKAMELIEKLEKEKRGPYAGAVGYFSLSGETDFCIAIRTIILKDRHYLLQAGAGIVYDSFPEREYDESLDKAAALKKAIQIAGEGL